MTRFLKMHGAGNDFVVFDARAGGLDLTPARVAGLADRQSGIGCDQLIVMEAPALPGADVFMRIFNHDGTAATACGNATRCVAELFGRADDRARVVVQTVAGLLPAERLGAGRVCVDMGEPRFGWQDVPLARPCDTLHLDLPGDPAALSMGNPHATFFVPSVDEAEIGVWGPALQQDALFPDGANIGFAQVVGPERIRLVVWERGAGRTLACGSGACAALVNASRRGLTGRKATLELDGGVLQIEWRAADSHVLMTGPTAVSFQGEVELATYPA